MKKYILIFLCFITISCQNKKNTISINGSWYRINENEKEYEEIHVDDSLFIYCYNNCNIIIPFLYFIEKDSIHIGSKKDMGTKYHIQLLNNGQLIALDNILETKTFNKINVKYDNLNDFLINYNTLDSLAFDYHKRKQGYFNNK